MLLLCSGKGRQAFHVWACQRKFSGSKSHLLGTLSTTQNPIPQIFHRTSTATVRIWDLCCMRVGSRKASVSPNFWYGCWRIEESGRRSRNQCAKNCSCWTYRCSPCLGNSPWTTTLPIPHPASASPHASWSSCEGIVSPVTSRNMLCKHVVCS
jgi:hypothetical protein